MLALFGFGCAGRGPACETLHFFLPARCDALFFSRQRYRIMYDTRGVCVRSVFRVIDMYVDLELFRQSGARSSAGARGTTPGTTPGSATTTRVSGKESRARLTGRSIRRNGSALLRAIQPNGCGTVVEVVVAMFPRGFRCCIRCLLLLSGVTFDLLAWRRRQNESPRHSFVSGATIYIQQ